MIGEVDGQYSGGGEGEEGEENGPGKASEDPGQEQFCPAKRAEAEIGKYCSGHNFGRGVRLYLLEKGPGEYGAVGPAWWYQKVNRITDRKK